MIKKQKIYNFYISLIALLLSTLYLSANRSIDRAVLIAVTIDSSSSERAFILQWDTSDTNAAEYVIGRKLKGENDWLILDTVPSTVNTYRDITDNTSNAYEYMILKSVKDSSYYGYGYIYTGYDVKMLDYRGRAIVVIDETIMEALRYELERYRNDLQGDGYSVSLIKSERAETFNPAAVQRTKRAIDYEISKYPGEEFTLILIGRVPVPYAGNTPWDGHNPDHSGAWPSDVYYSVPSGTFTDMFVYNMRPAREENKNIPWDGKFDQSVIINTEIKSGRIDFYNLPTFEESEIELLRRYFDKNHAFRQARIKPIARALLDDGFGMYTKEAFAATAWMNFSSLLGSDAIDSASYRYDLRDREYLWSYACNQGSYTSVLRAAYSDEFAVHNYNSIFTMLLGSYFGDWDTENNLLRSAIASRPSILAAAWSGRPFWFFHHMALGEPIGYSAMITQNNTNLYKSTGNQGLRGTHINLMGDPTLRMTYAVPPSDLKIASDTKEGDRRKIKLIWKNPTDDVLGFYVYRSTDKTAGFSKLSEELVQGVEFTDEDAPSEDVVYMVRAVKHEGSVTGSYYNLSQGVMIDAGKSSIISSSDNTKNTLDITIYPNPASEKAFALLEYDAQAVLSYEIFNSMGQSILSRSNISLQKGINRVDLSINQIPTLPGGAFLIIFSINGNIYLGKLTVNY